MRHESAHYSALERFLSSAGLLRTTSVLLQPDGGHLTLVHYTRLMGNAHLCEFVSRKRQRRQEDEDKEKKKKKILHSQPLPSSAGVSSQRGLPLPPKVDVQFFFNGTSQSFGVHGVLGASLVYRVWKDAQLSC